MIKPRYLIDYERRKEDWLKSTGLRKSNAKHTRVLPWLNKYTLPEGFDHTNVYYYPGGKFHILITEPYYSFVIPMESLSELARKEGKSFSYSFGDDVTGLWYPGNCFAMLVAEKEHGKLLSTFAERLPK